MYAKQTDSSDSRALRYLRLKFSIVLCILYVPMFDSHTPPPPPPPPPTSSPPPPITRNCFSKNFNMIKIFDYFVYECRIEFLSVGIRTSSV